MKGIFSWRIVLEIVAALIALVLTVAGCTLTPAADAALRDLLDSVSVQDTVAEEPATSDLSSSKSLPSPQ